MPEYLQIPALLKTVEPIAVIPSTAWLVLEFGTPTQPGRSTVLLGVRDESGEWREDLENIPSRHVIADNLDLPEVHPLRQIATLANSAIMDAVIPDVAPYNLMGWQGKSIRELGSALIAAQLQGELEP